ncbi:uncharacterized protein PODANS_5_8520 [Podospora anserina S mat+]|uniref:Podospora anserina S mat+ genomic DNA chromosome 5, supercontig 9 n=1 Tax=Podospora anserina (strain S / ATCC MYA-4624 / DSM 980 / FGSC 10383) TaxID=515849 RepID=B2AL29_PODAN|nr:uncharacterized protein PODANS_5_8520 [Podospora anserina S mat+]CAP64577.1 unnamed protein product [Podospora anserina S mat+]CDP29974.1 Putative protein of unknown function [Podospora anserina S mat+]
MEANSDRCTRELPKCAACKPWPGPCNYARQFPDPVAAPVAAPSSATLEPANIFVSSSLPDRLDRIEATLQTLTAAVTKLLAVTEAKSSQEPKPESNPAAKQPDETDRSTRSKTTCTITPPAISSLDEANAHLGNIIPSHDDHDDHNDHSLALQNLTDLSNTLTSFRLDMSLDLGPHDNRQYIIPSLETGNLIISKFTPLTLFASPFFTPPSLRLLSTIIFSPGTVAPGWIIYANYFLLSSPITATLFPSSVPHWRHNVRLALQNASLYLHPSKVNIAAFTMLSFHGEDFAASPNVSWMLCSHLCRMAQALRLWEGGGAEEGEGEEEKQRGLALFWAIYNMEKCCALTFGRSQVGLWEGVDVERVEMPRGEWFGGFRPHLTDQRRAKGVEGVDAEFGGYIFLRNVELAKLSGRVLEYLGKGEGTEEEREVLKGRLAEWFRETDETFRRRVERERQGGVPGAGVDVKREKVMRLYEFTVKFRYLHVLIILTKDSPGDRGLRVESARQAIGILPMTISGWDPVYNGVIWCVFVFQQGRDSS